jgi:DNA repair exonuclease SbcCD ATPase subunit
VIEYALLFALGFLTAALLGLMIAPAIQRRIVRFAEDRLKATMPLSPQEVRAQKDAARATYAAENAKTRQALRRERDKGVALMLQNERIHQEARRLADENTDLQAQVADMNVEVTSMRSTVRELELRMADMRASFENLQRDDSAKGETVRQLNSRLDKHAAEIDSLRIDLAARETESEHLKSRVAGLRDEPEALRANLKAENARAREMELRLGRDENRIRQLETKLARETAANADRESALEHRAEEIEKLKTRVKTANQEIREATKALRAAGMKLPKQAPPNPAAANGASGKGNAIPEGADVAGLSEDLRMRATALSERLTNSKSTAHDEALREEVAGIAAGMVALTAMREGETSPIHGLLAGEEPAKPGAHRSLARRAKEMLPSK